MAGVFAGAAMSEPSSTHESMKKLWDEHHARKKHDPVNHPSHYTSHPSGVECVDIAEHFEFNIGNAIKYLWRAGLKSTNAIEDLKKAAWYVNREIERLGKREIVVKFDNVSHEWWEVVPKLKKERKHGKNER